MRKRVEMIAMGRNLTQDEFNGLASRLLAVVREYRAKGCSNGNIACAISDIAVRYLRSVPSN